MIHQAAGGLLPSKRCPLSGRTGEPGDTTVYSFRLFLDYVEYLSQFCSKIVRCSSTLGGFVELRLGGSPARQTKMAQGQVDEANMDCDTPDACTMRHVATTEFEAHLDIATKTALTDSAPLPPP